MVKRWLIADWSWSGLLAMLIVCSPGFWSWRDIQRGSKTSARQESVQASAPANFATKMKCAERAEAYLKRERGIAVSSDGINATVKNEQFAYNKTLDTCLLYFEVTEFGVGTTYNIVDTLSYKKLYSHLGYLDRHMRASWDAFVQGERGMLERRRASQKAR